MLIVDYEVFDTVKLKVRAWWLDVVPIELLDLHRMKLN